MFNIGSTILGGFQKVNINKQLIFSPIIYAICCGVIFTVILILFLDARFDKTTLILGGIVTLMVLSGMAYMDIMTRSVVSKDLDDDRFANDVDNSGITTNLGGTKEIEDLNKEIESIYD